jgi:UDP-N-acetylglucosamine--N-acetylmuramyl-(pentapeptide) pyrophosphoryl-undecaprenol N-acetylglucosamine transferase
VGAEQGLESKIIPKEGFRLKTLPIGGFKRMGVQRQLKNAWAMAGALLRARGILSEFRPDVVIGVGGYASFPILAAAILGGYPRVIMEQNALPGLANRTLGKWVDYIAVTDPKTVSFFGKRAVVTGNPIRPQFQTIPPKSHVPPFTILVFGGSQGAESINRAVTDALEHLQEFKGKMRFVHQTGERQVEEVRRAYAARNFAADVRPFFNDFYEQYASADLIVSRAGATTVAEIKAAGRASILIPLPYAADDHQSKNAKAMVEEQAAEMISNAELNGKRMADQIRVMISNPGRLEQIETNARRIAILDAEQRIVNLVEAAIQKKRKR